MTRRLLALPLLLVPITLAHGAQAQVCLASATGVAFANYNPFAASPTDSTGSVTVSCTTVTPVSVSYSIALNGGLGTIAARKMIVGPSALAYQLYTDAARSTVWGDGTSGSATVSDSYGLGTLGSAQRTYTVYGRITARQNVSPGIFADLITVLVSY